MATLRQRTSFGPGIYRGHKFDLDRLRSFVDGTNRAIAAGVPIPLLLRHAPINADDTATTQFANGDKGAGWITKVEQEADGNIAWEASGVPDPVITAAQTGNLKFTSPEFRSHYSCEKAGVYEGPIIRHFAFTPTPGNPHQGAIESVALEEEVWQFEESDVIPFAVEVEQFAVDKRLYFLEKHGYKHPTKVPSGTAYSNKTHSLTLHSSGLWTHHKLASVGKEAKISSGSGHEELAYHLAKVHGTQHSERGDDSYTGSFVKPTVTQPPSLKSGSDKSVDWDTLTPDVKSKILESIKSGKNTADIQKLFSISGAVASKAVEEWNKTMSQHAEFPVDKRKGIDNKEDDVELEVTKPGEGDVNAEVQQQPMGSNDNPDMPPKATDKSKLAAIVAGLKLKGMVVPSDWNPDNEGAMDILLATLNTAIEAENKAKAEESEDDEDDENVTDAPMPFSEQDNIHVHAVQHLAGKTKGKFQLHSKKTGYSVSDKLFDNENDASKHIDELNKNPSAMRKYKFNSSQHTEQPTGDYAMQFTEEELASMPASVKAKLDAEIKVHKDKALEATAKAQQFEEAEKVAINTAAKDKAIATIEGSKIPSGMKVELLASYDGMQFSEGEEQPLYTNVQVAELFSKYIPKHLQFDEDDEDIVEGSTPKGTHEQFFEGDTPVGHVSAERAKQLVDSNPFINNRMTQRSQPLSSISDLVKGENERVPNNVRGSGF